MQTVVLSILLAAIPGVATLRLSQDPLVVGATGDVDVLPPAAIGQKARQVMYNVQDVQYFADLTVGGQPITGLLDTGSFDLVVFDQACEGCGDAGTYSSSRSSSYTAGLVTQTMEYGSGSVEAREAFDQVALGPYGEINLTFWNVMDADMPVLESASFNSIVGVGPPETSGSDAWSLVEDDMHELRRHLQNENVLPSATATEELKKAVDLATVAGIEPTLIKADNVAHFSICLGRKSGSVGYFTWNDTSYLDTPSLFTYIKVLGKHTWTINMTNMQLSLGGKESGLFGCQHGCGAIVDSGTSLLLMPEDAIEALRAMLRDMNVDCTNIHSLPELTFKLAGKDFVLPPHAYISQTEDWGEEDSSNFNVKRNRLAEKVRLDFGGGECELAVMGSRSETNWGPLWILGMPFLRSYYTTFKVGRNHDERALFTAPAGGDCTPAGSDSDLARKSGYEEGLRTLNRSAMFIPHIVHKARTQAFLSNL